MIPSIRLVARAASTLAAALVLATPALAQVHEGDIILNTETGQIRAGAITGGEFVPRSIFLTRLGVNAPNVSSDPGFDCLPGSFSVGTRNGLTLVGALQEWNGTEFVPSDAEHLRVEYLTLATDGPGPSASPDQAIDTFTISIQANGQWHRHFRWVLVDGPTIGVYAQRVRVRCDAGVPMPSDDFYLLINQGGAAQADVDAAGAWLQQLMGGAGECPACAADFDANGGIDGADLAAFFTSYEQGAACADVDANGGIDGADLAAFFLAYESGGC